MKKLISVHSLYQRQIFEPWDDSYNSQTLPCFILGVDFDSHPGWRYRPASPSDCRLVDHQVDGTRCGRVVLPAIILDPTPAGQVLLADLREAFASWGGGVGRGGNLTLSAILEYRQALHRHGVDCDESFKEGLMEGWYPIDISRLWHDQQFLRKLCATKLPENLGDLLVQPDGEKVDWYNPGFVSQP